MKYFLASNNKNFILPILFICLSITTFFISFNAALKLKMDTEPPYWVWAAVPPAFSNVAFGTRRFMTLDFIHIKFNDGTINTSAATINKGMAELKNVKKTSEMKELTMPGEDKGIVILIELAFKLFGFKVEGVLYIYYLILGFAGIIFAFAYRHNPYALLLLATFYFCHRLILPMIKYDGQLAGVLALRCIPLLALIPLLHCILFFFEKKIRLLQFVLAFFQIGLLTFIIFVRSTTVWMFALIVIISIIVLILRKEPNLINLEKYQYKRYPAALILTFLVFFYSTLNLFLHRGLPDEYYSNGQIATRVFWHNIYSGFAFNPNFSSREHLRIDDFTTLEAVEKFLNDNGRANEWTVINGPSQNYTTISWAPYDLVVRELVVDRCSSYFLDCITAFFWYKPIAMIENIAWVYGFKQYPPNIDLFVSKHHEIGTVVKEQFIFTSNQLDRYSERGLYWILRIFFFALLFYLLARIYPCKEKAIPVVASSGILFFGSMVPSIAGYAAPHTIAELALTTPLFLVTLASLLPLYRGIDVK